jgi:hypothetical protein
MNNYLTVLRDGEVMAVRPTMGMPQGTFSNEAAYYIELGEYHKHIASLPAYAVDQSLKDKGAGYWFEGEGQYQYLMWKKSGTWVGCHKSKYDKSPEDRRRIIVVETKTEKMVEKEETLCSVCGVPLSIHNTCCGWQNANLIIFPWEQTIAGAMSDSEKKRRWELRNDHLVG